MTEYNNRIQEQVLSLTKGSTYSIKAWQIKYKKAVSIKYPRGRVLQRLAGLEMDKHFRD